MVEANLPLYENTRSHFTKRLNLALRGWIYRWAYLPKLQQWGIFEEVENALEIGSGYGTKLSHSVQKIPKVNFQGVEHSPSMLKRGQSLYPDLSDIMTEDDATTLNSIKDDSQDVLMYYQMLHHLNWEDLEKAVEQAKRVLRVDGKIAVIDTFLDNQNDGLSKTRRIIFNTIEPIYSLISTDSGKGYENQPQAAFVQFMEANGFTFTHEDKPFGKFSVSEILVFKKND